MKSSLKELWESWWNKATNPLGWGIFLVVIFLVVGWHVLAVASRPAHMIEMTAEIGSQGRFIGSPAANDDGSRVSFFKGTETGDGLFVCDLANGQQRLIYEDSGNRRHAQFGWSPDGKLLAFPALKDEKKILIIYNGDSKQIETNILGYVNELAWLSPSSFAYLKGSNLMWVTKNLDSSWSKPDRFDGAVKKTGKNTGKTSQPPRQPGIETVPEYPPIKNLMGISSDSVAWVGGNAIWEWKLHANAPASIWESSSNTLVECCYSREREAFLLRLRDATTGDRLAAFYPDRQQLVDLDNLNNTNVSDVLWINHGKGYACLLNESGLHSIFIKADCADGRPVWSVPQDGVRTMTVGGNCIYAIGSLDGQPRGVVEYDTTSGSARYAGSSRPRFLYATNVIPLAGTITNSLGEIHAYSLWMPVQFDSRKKYPLVLAQQMRVWNQYAQATANAGAFYVSVERPDFDDPQIKRWKEDVMAAYQLMFKNPNVDTNNIYLYGSSAETVHLVQLLDQEPALWKGAMLGSPMAYPNLSKTRIAKLLINCGEADEYNVFDRARRFQEEAARAGIPVTVAAHSTGHVFISATANKESNKQFVQFIFE